MDSYFQFLGDFDVYLHMVTIHIVVLVKKTGDLHPIMSSPPVELKSHEVHLLAVSGCERQAFVDVFPYGKHQQTSLGTSIKLFTLGLRQRSETVA